MKDDRPILPVAVQESPPCDRLTAQLYMVHDQCGVTPVPIRRVFTRMLETSHQPYVRHLPVKPATALDFFKGCWIEEEDIGYVIIENTTAVRLGKPPCEEFQCLYLMRDDNKTEIIRPGLFYAGEMHNPAAGRLVAHQPGVTASVHIFPR
jgi:hypothetical protein